jgi:hypothetical protein
LLMHHPVHAFRSDRFDRFATSAFDSRDRVARTLGRVPFQLLLAGHRHALDPEPDQTYVATNAKQDPLPKNVAQLVAESPTMEPIVYDDIPKVEDRWSNSFSLYRLIVDDQRNVLEVERQVFRIREGSAHPFQASPRKTAIADLRLE